MKKPLLGSALLLGLLITLGVAARPAAASDWFIGGGFRVGGLYFSLAFDGSPRDLGPNYYRTRHRVAYQGYRCGSYCLKRSGYVYHHSGCPLVLHHFRRHGFHPARAWDHYRGPRSYGSDRGRSHGHRDYGHRDRGRREIEPRDYRYRPDYRDRHRSHDPRYCPYR